MKRLFLICSVMALAGCSLFSPYGESNIPKPTPLEKLTPSVTARTLWETNVGTASQGAFLKLTPAVTTQAIYTIDQSGHLVATSLSGKKQWEVNFKNGGKSDLTSDGSAVAFVDAKGILYVLNATDGKTLWQTTLSSQALAPPTLLPTQVLTKTIDGNVTSFNRQTGGEQWQYTADTPDLMLHASSPILTQGNTAYVGFANGQVVALNLKTGDTLWIQQVAQPQGFADVERMVDIDANLILQPNRLFVATYQGQVVTLDPHTGKILWRQPNSVYANIAADSNALYAIHADGTITAYRANSGKILWEQKALGWRFLSGATRYKNTLAMGDMEGYVHFLSPENGHLIGRFQFTKKPASIINAPIPLSDALVIINTEGQLGTISLNT